MEAVVKSANSKRVSAQFQEAEELTNTRVKDETDEIVLVVYEVSRNDRWMEFEKVEKKGRLQDTNYGYHIPIRIHTALRIYSTYRRVEYPKADSRHDAGTSLRQPSKAGFAVRYPGLTTPSEPITSCGAC